MSDAYSPVPELNLLKAFADRVGRVYYSDGFELHEYGADVGLGTWSEEPEFLSRFIPFACANGSGSSYAFWRCDDRADLAGLPIAFIGDEGDLYIVARNLLELFQLLAIDDEALQPEFVEEHSEAHEEYLAWLEETFGLRPPEDIDALRTAAKEDDDRFQSWLAQMGIGQ
ncbi:hypothetical protein [Glycomyces sp. NPDC021274]|uniref:hypothetical protein n=1 Tax=Glycomyces sp. NPDC021274 TaxID=3155120 RepID=UPI0033D170C3